MGWAVAGLTPTAKVVAVAAATTGTSRPAHRRARTRLAGLLFRCFPADRMVMQLSP
ncbi:MAG: hypothetical protein ACRDS1_18770 [Pseudonocardiaceae bacterium]